MADSVAKSVGAPPPATPTTASTTASTAASTAAARRRDALAKLRLCPLCGDASDRDGRFCSSCLGMPAGTGRDKKLTRPARPWLRATAGLRWLELVFLTVDVLAGGATAALVFRLLGQAHHGLTRGLPATRVIGHGDLTLAAIVGVGMLASAVGSGLLFSAWMFAAYHDAGALGLRPRWHAGWAIGSWLVPFANLWWPKRIVEELWLGSSRSVPVGYAIQRRASTPLVSAWWTLLLASGILPLLAWGAFAATRHWWFESLGPTIEFGLCAVVLAVICRVANGLLAMVLMDSITTRQNERAAALQPGSPV